jgi:peptidylprolyl isomerase
MRTLLCAALAAVILGVSAACSSGPDNSGYRLPRTPVPATATPVVVQVPMPPVSGEPVTLPDGLQYVEIQPGDGQQPRSGQTVRVHYTGWFTANGQKFDSSYDHGGTFSFVLGSGEVIKGWDEGVSMMRVGEKRRLIIPPALAYGSQGNARIPANSSLTFDVELVAVEG